MARKSIDVCRDQLPIVDKILIERESQHGDPKENLDRVAAYWSNHLSLNLTRQDVAIMLMQLKMARLNTGNEPADSLRDLIGYAAIATGMAALNEQKTNEESPNGE